MACSLGCIRVRLHSREVAFASGCIRAGLHSKQDGLHQTFGTSFSSKNQWRSNSQLIGREYHSIPVFESISNHRLKFLLARLDARFPNTQYRVN